MANVHLTREQKDELLNKVKIGGENVQNVNFIRNEIVKDGLVEGVFIDNFNSENDFTLFFEMEYKGVGDSTKIFGMGASSTGGYQLILGSTAVSLQYREVGATSWTTQTFLQLSVGGLYTIVMRKTNNSIYINVNGEWYRYNNLSIQNLTGRISFNSSTRYSLSKQYLYNKSLAQQEIQHNFSILNNNKSINRINDYAISTDTDHVQDRTGRVQDTINRVFYKQNCKEFTSDGADISVNNGLDGYVLSGKIEGQTVKCIYADSDWITKVGNGSAWNPEIVDLSKMPQVKPSTSYVLLVEIKENTYQSRWAMSSSYSTRSFSDFNIEIGSVGIYKGVITSKSDLTVNNVGLYSVPSVQSMGTITFRRCLLEITNTELVNKFLPFGLHSTTATISNNGMKYSFYKDVEDRAQNEVIGLEMVDGVGDTLEIKEDGSAILTQRIYRHTFTGKEIFSSSDGAKTPDGKRYAQMNYVSNNIPLASATLRSIATVPTMRSSENAWGNPTFEGFTFGDEKITFYTTKQITNAEIRVMITGVTACYGLITPIITHIPKELVPTILTQLENNISFGGAVMATKATISVPINKIAEMEARLSQLEKSLPKTTEM